MKKGIKNAPNDNDMHVICIIVKSANMAKHTSVFEDHTRKAKLC